MLLAVDIGNTNILAGLFEGDVLKATWRLSTSRERKAGDYGKDLAGLISGSGYGPGELKGAIISSVVPALEGVIVEAVEKSLGPRPLIAGSDVPYGIPVATDNPEEVGPDRVVNAVSAQRLYGKPLIIVDFGTAITFDYVNEKGEFAGGAIAPGVGISVEALHLRTAKLPLIEVQRPGRAIGRDTVSAMRSGAFFGFLGLVDGVIERMKAEVPVLTVVATGGWAPTFAPHSRHIKEIDQALILKGLRIIYEEGT